MKAPTNAGILRQFEKSSKKSTFKSSNPPSKTALLLAGNGATDSDTLATVQSWALGKSVLNPDKSPLGRQLPWW